MSFLAVIRRATVVGTAGLGTFAAYRYSAIQERESQLPSEPLQVFGSLQHKKGQKHKVIVIGGGVVGVSTAYKLALAGHSVALLEAASAPSKECSACAAGGMQVSNPVVDRDTWIAVFQCMNPLATTFKFFHIDWLETLSDPFFVRWVSTFTRTSLFPDARQKEKQQEMLEFTKYAVAEMVQMMENRWGNMARRAGYNNTGSLAVSYDPVDPATASSSNSNTNPSNSKMNLEPALILYGTEITQIEPSLRFQEEPPTSAKYEYQAKSASAERFTLELADRCRRKLGVHFAYDTKVQAISVQATASGDKQRISELKTNRGRIAVAEGTKVVVAAGSWTPRVLALMDLYAPVYPLKGYSLSLSASQVLKHDRALQAWDLPSRIVSDKLMFTSRLGDEIRITSIGEFSGWVTKPTPKVDAAFRLEASRQFPQLPKDMIAAAATRCGHRPYVSDGILLLGKVDTHEDVYVSCGPGSNGWKLAMESAEVIERLISG